MATSGRRGRRPLELGLVASLLAIAVLSGRARAQSAVGAAEEAPGCEQQITFSSLQMPPSAKLQFALHAMGTRNYSCSPQFAIGPGMQVSEVSSLDGELEGESWSESAFLGITDLYLTSTGEYAGRVTVDTTVPGSVFVQPAPDPSDLAWGRFKCATSGPHLPKANYVVRTDTSGGGPPPRGSCTQGNVPADGWITVEYNQTATFWLCT